MIVYSDLVTTIEASEKANSWAFQFQPITPLQERTQSEVLKHAETVGLGVTTRRLNESDQRILETKVTTFFYIY